MLHAVGSPRASRISTVLHLNCTTWSYIHQGLDKIFNDVLKQSFSQNYILAYVCSYIQWWSIYGCSWNGIHLLEPQKSILHVFMHANSTNGLGSVFGDKWFSTRYPCYFHSQDIQFKEIYLVLQATLRWDHLWKGNHIILYVDNTAVVSALLSGSMQSPQVMNMLRLIIMLAAWLGFTYNSSWLASADNSLADATS